MSLKKKDTRVQLKTGVKVKIVSWDATKEYMARTSTLPELNLHLFILDEINPVDLLGSETCIEGYEIGSDLYKTGACRHIIHVNDLEVII